MNHTYTPGTLWIISPMATDCVPLIYFTDDLLHTANVYPAYTWTPMNLFQSTERNKFVLHLHRLRESCCEMGKCITVSENCFQAHQIECSYYGAELSVLSGFHHNCPFIDFVPCSCWP